MDIIYFRSIQFSRSVMSNSLQPHESQHARPPCPSPTPRVYSGSCPLSQWCHPTISSSFVPFSSCPQSFPASRSFQVSQLFAWGGQSIGVSASASVLPMNTQDWSPLVDWLDLLAVQGTLKSLLQHHSSKIICLKEWKDDCNFKSWVRREVPFCYPENQSVYEKKKWGAFPRSPSLTESRLPLWLSYSQLAQDHVGGYCEWPGCSPPWFSKTHCHLKELLCLRVTVLCFAMFCFWLLPANLFFKLLWSWVICRNAVLLCLSLSSCLQLILCTCTVSSCALKTALSCFFPPLSTSLFYVLPIKDAYWIIKNNSKYVFWDSSGVPLVLDLLILGIVTDNLWPSLWKRIWKRIDMCAHITESLFCTPETIKHC